MNRLCRSCIIAPMIRSFTQTIVAGALCWALFLLAGCGVVQSMFEGDSSVPVTEPEHVNPAASRALSGTDANGQTLWPIDPNLVVLDPDAVPARPVQPADQAVPDANAAEGEMVSASVIRVNDRYVTSEEILRRVAPAARDIPPSASRREFAHRIRRAIAETIQTTIRELLVVAEARDRLSEPIQRYIDERVVDFRRKLIARGGGSVETIRAQLVREGTTLEQVLEDHRRRLTYVLYLREKFRSSASVNRREMMAYYRAHRESQFKVDKTVQMRLLAVPYDKFAQPGDRRITDQARAKAREHMDRAMAALRGGTAFEEVVEDFSRGPKRDQGGLWPPMKRGSFLQAVEEVAFSLEPGEVSDVIETDRGLYVVQAHRVVDEHYVSFEQAQETIEKTLRERREQQLHNEYHRRLREEANISYSPEFLERVAQVAERRFGQTDEP